MNSRVKGIAREDIIIYRSRKPLQNRLLIGTPTRGTVRMEWAQARFGQTIPCNWSHANSNIGYSHAIPLGHLVDDAQNIIVDIAIKNNYEWLFLHEDDVVLPIDAFVKLNQYMREPKVPVVSGLYYLKGEPTEPIAYRGRGNSAFDKFKIGDKVWVDGVPTGCLLIHMSILRLMANESEMYQTFAGAQVKKVFEAPRIASFDPEHMTIQQASGTSDLYWCDRVMREDVLRRAGWSKVGRRKNPFLLDTTIACGHIDLSTGTVYPKPGRNGSKPT